MARTGARALAAGAGTAMVLGCASPAFVSASSSSRGAPQPQLRASAQAAPQPAFGASASAIGVFGAAAAAATAVTCRAAAVKKKGVRMVEGKEIPWNLFSPKAPYKASVISNETITTKSPLVNWETTHTVFRHDKNMPYLEGQSIGVIAPGPDKKGETPAKVRLYSIASSACGDDETSETVSLCVKRVLEVEGRGWCEYNNVELPDPEFPEAEKVYRGVCSGHICDLKAGDDVLLTGPTGAEMLLPEDPEANIIMMATGTGVAPFRSFLRYLFHDKATRKPRNPVAKVLSGGKKFNGKAWLFLGVPFSNSLLYDEEWKEMKETYPNNFNYDYAISDEMKNKEGKPMWVQHKVMEYADEIWEMLKDPKTHVYMCGLKGMESGFAEAFGEQAAKENIDLKAYVKEMKKAKRYHVEVY